MSTTTRTRLVEVRRPLLALHRALIEASLIDHERRHGRVELSNRIELVQTHPAFTWLRPIFSLLLRIDQALDDESTAVDSLLAETERLLSPADRGDELGRKYVEVLQEYPDAVLAHGALRRAVERGKSN